MFLIQSTSTFPQLETTFGISSQAAILSLTLFIFGMGTGPLLFGGMSEFLGRNLMYRLSFISFFLFTFPVAFANHFGTSWSI